MSDPYGLGLGNMFSGKGVDYNAVGLDTPTADLITANTNHALQSQNQLANEQNAGIKNATGEGLQTNQQLQAQAAGTAQNPAMLQAIRNQYGQQAQQGINSIVKRNELNSPLTQANYLRQAAEMAQAQQNVTLKNYEGLTNAYNKNMTARAQVISSVFSVLGAGGGMAMNNDLPGQTKGKNHNRYDSGGGQSNTDSFNSGSDMEYTGIN